VYDIYEIGGGERGLGWGGGVYVVYS
jgi:hypothetical protein